VTDRYLPRLQRGFRRNGPDHRAGADVSFADIVKIFGFQRVRLGRWVSPAETQLAANLFFDALCDLQLLLAVPAVVISLRGSLQLSFGIGGEPGSCAFYEPGRRNLALAKNAGGGSLAHEWFHAFDHYISPFLFSDRPASAFASELWLSQAPAISHPLNDLLLAGYRHILLDQTGTEPSALLRRAIQLDSQFGCFYFARPQEVTARFFEAMLQQAALKNAFLVSGCVPKAGLPSPYPTTAELTAGASCWHAYFSALGRALG
jgi:hypothetical protein